MSEKKELKSVVFFGTPDFAVASLSALLEKGFPVRAVVTTPDKPAGRGRKPMASAVKKFAEKHHLPILQPTRLKSPFFLEQLRSYHADLQIVVAFRMLPEVVWDMPPLGTLNVHAALLPQYRGAAPINHAIINGETETGITTFRLKQAIDTGDILLQKKVTIAPDDNFGSLYLKLMKIGAEVLIDTLNQLTTGNLNAIPQREIAHLHPAPKIFKENCWINWNQPAKKIHDFIRGLSPQPGAITYLKGKRIKILETKVVSDLPDDTPKTIDTTQKGHLKIAATKDWIDVLLLQPEGKKVMYVKDFLNGYKP